jgi:hypothetical protein
MHVYETTDPTVGVVLRTFASVFPSVSIWQPAMGDLILIGSRQPLRVDLDATARRFAEPAVQSDLARVGLLTLPTILAREIIPQQNGLYTIPTDVPLHSDMVPQLEYMAQRGFFLKSIADRWRQFREDTSHRASTLLGTYLKSQPLNPADFAAFVRDYQEHQIPEPNVFRSLLLAWQGDATQPAFPLDLWSIASEHMTTAELRVLRMAPFSAAMLAEAGSNPKPLRAYASDLMESYRAQRSVFYLPPTAELERVLQRLADTDRPRRRLYLLYLAELAWDRGEDERCFELGQRAFDPDTAREGPVDFSTDAAAPCAVLYRMIETLYNQRRLDEAWALCQQANAGGYVSRSLVLFPMLSMSYRKVEAAESLAPPLRTP